MSFATEAVKNVASHRILVEIDIGDLNEQWVNIGAGIWMVSATNTYDFVDSSLLDGFTAQGFAAIGSVTVDGLPLTYVKTLLEVTTTNGSFFYDAVARALYIRLDDYSQPQLHTVIIGVMSGYSQSDYTPTDSNQLYSGRLRTSPSVSAKRDPLFWGRMQFGGATVDLLNGDGELDTFGELNNLYGNEARILLGFDSLSWLDYERLFTGYVEKVGISESTARIALKDTRKQLTKAITYACTDANALEAIEDILYTSYGIPYNATFFDTGAWESARADVENVTIDMQEPAPTIDVIEDICGSVFGLFLVLPDGRFTFKVSDAAAGQVTEIPKLDIMNELSFDYDPSEVVSSVRVGYARDWAASAASAYTYYTDTSLEATVYETYKTYNEKTFETFLPDLAAATAFATRVLSSVSTIRPRVRVEVPIRYYAVEIGDLVRATLDREVSTMLGEKVCEVLGKGYRLDTPSIELELRVIGAVTEMRETEESGWRVTEDDRIRIVS